jgi:hypothetical protein
MGRSLIIDIGRVSLFAHDFDFLRNIHLSSLSLSSVALVVHRAANRGAIVSVPGDLLRVGAEELTLFYTLMAALSVPFTTDQL